MGRAIVTSGDFTAYVCDSAATRPSSRITLGRLVSNKRITNVTMMTMMIKCIVGDKFKLAS